MFNGDPNKPLKWLHIGPSGCSGGICGGEAWFTAHVEPTKEDPRDKLIEHYEKMVVRLEKEIERLETNKNIPSFTPNPSFGGNKLYNIQSDIPIAEIAKILATNDST